MNTCLASVVYPHIQGKDGWMQIPEEDMVVVFDADMICRRPRHQRQYALIARLLIAFWQLGAGTAPCRAIHRGRHAALVHA
jgi:hypothetical protein